MDVLTVKGLKKSFGDKKVLYGLDLTVPQNSIFGFVGKNGAGKTTAMKAVLGLMTVDDGEMYVCGERVKYGQTPTNRYIGYLPDVPEFYSFMTCREYLRLCGECLNMKKKDIADKSEELLSLVGLDCEKHRIKGFSRGMKQRLGIAQALLGSPKLLICDEPTSALDPIGRKEILDILLSVRNRTTVLFSTHILSDVERICTDIAVLNGGKIALKGSVEELKNGRGEEGFSVEVLESEGAKKLADFFGNASLEPNDTVVFTQGGAKMFDVLDYMKENSISFRKVEKMQPTLESLFMEAVEK